MINIENLSLSYDGKTTIIHLEGKSAENVSGYAIYSEWDDNKKDSVGDRELKTQDAFDLIFAVRRWFCRVSNMKAPDRNSWNNELWLWDYDGGIKAQLDAMQDRSSKPEMV